MPTIRLATDADMRAISSQNLADLKHLPYVYIPTPEPDVMRVWGVAHERGFEDTARLYPGALVAPRYAGERASWADLVYHGAEPAAAFVSAS